MVECFTQQAQETCVPQSWVCTEHFDCLKHNGCKVQNVSVTNCFDDEFWCHINETCIDATKVCDNEVHCVGAEDEALCLGKTNHFTVMRLPN